LVDCIFIFPCSTTPLFYLLFFFSPVRGHAVP
jgi:hypothetical protein